jgi:hypothetical protein
MLITEDAIQSKFEKYLNLSLLFDQQEAFNECMLCTTAGQSCLRAGKQRVQQQVISINHSKQTV